jgi:hypothetical protein
VLPIPQRRREWKSPRGGATVRTCRSQKLNDSAAYRGLRANLSATGATGRFALRRAQNPRNSAAFRRSGATTGCELRTWNFGQSLAKYRTAPPRTRFRPGRTRLLNGLAEQSAEWRTFRSPSRLSDITFQTTGKLSEAKQPAGLAAGRTFFECSLIYNLWRTASRLPILDTWSAYPRLGAWLPPLLLLTARMRSGLPPSQAQHSKVPPSRRAG